jgi:2'-5' RNA ligase
MDLRCFIAIELPEALRREIGARTEGLRSTDADVRWVPQENLHLTLKFLGRVPEELLPEINSSLTEAMGSHRRLSLRFSGAGVFPSVRRPRVVWIGVVDSDRLTALQQDVEGAMEALGFESEHRPFSPHLTLGRLRSQRGSAALLRELDAIKDAAFDDVEVEDIAVMKSELKPTGAKYHRLFGIPLARG